MSKFKLDKGTKLAWLQALRSGEYVQAEGVLRGSTYDSENRGFRVGHCCLGVLAECAGFLNGDNAYEAERPGNGENDGYLFGKTYEVLPAHVQKRLATMNDEGKSFDDIADWIEEYL